MNRRCFTLLVCFFCLTFPSWGDGQGGATVPDVSPTPLIRLTGVLEANEHPGNVALPLLKVWIGDKAWLFRVSRVEPVFSAYRAEDYFRRISPLGLRFVTDNAVLKALQSPEMHDLPIVIEGRLRVKPGVLHVRSVRTVKGHPDGSSFNQ